MKKDRFDNFDPEVRQLVLSFENQLNTHMAFMDVESLEVIADFYLEMHDVQGLEAVVKYGEQLFPNNRAIKLRRAQLLTITNQFEPAYNLLVQLVDENPQNTDVQFAMAILYSMMGKSDKAVACYLKASKDGYDLDAIYSNIGDEYYKQKDFDKAVEYYLKAIADNPDESRSLYNLCYIWQEQHKLERAEQFFHNHVSEHPFSSAGWYCLGRIYYLEGNLQQAVDAFEYSLAADESNIDTYLTLSDVWRDLGDYARAVRTLHESIPFSDKSERLSALYRIGYIYMEQNNYHTASTYFKHVVTDDPSDAESWYHLGLCNQHLGNLDDAIECYYRVIDLYPDNDQPWLTLIDLYIEKENYPKAVALLESASAEADFPEHFVARLCYCYFKLGLRNRMFNAIYKMAYIYPESLSTLLVTYPDMALDSEVVNTVNNMLKR